jgi:hypothetical protein
VRDRRLALGRIAAVAAGVAAFVAVLATSSPAQAAYSPDAEAPSGTFLTFRGTSVQCLVFGPISTIEGKWGVLCFKGNRKQRAADTRWIMITPLTALSGTSESRTWKTITLATKITFNMTLPLDKTFELSGIRYTNNGQQARLACRYQVLSGSYSGEKGVICADTKQGNPIPNSTGVIMTQGRVAFVTFRGGRVEIDDVWRQPPCACDK